MLLIPNIIVVDDHDIFREGLCTLIELKGIAKNVEQATNGKEFLEYLDQNSPDLAIIDINMPVMDGITAAQKALVKYPDLKIIVLSLYGDQVYYDSMINAGVKGFILKSAGKNELELGIKTVMQGGNYFSNELLRNIIAEISHEQVKTTTPVAGIFTSRELEVLKWLCQGLAAQEISEKMNLSKKSIEGYRTRLFNKTGTKNSIALVVHAIKNEMVKIN